MKKYFKIVSDVTKDSFRKKIRSILLGRYFAGVEFINKKHIKVDDRSVIERGTKLWATNPQSKAVNISVDTNCWIGRDVEIQTYDNSEIVIMENVSIQDRCKILGSVYIGSDCMLAPEVFISSGTHNYALKPALTIKQQDKLFSLTADYNNKSDAVVIEEDCWLGKNVLIMKGVTIGRGAIIGTNAVVNKDVPPYEIWAGSPAKLVKKRFAFNPPAAIYANKMENRPYFYRGFDHSENGGDVFLSSNDSICVLENSDKISILLSGEIYVKGVLKIRVNNQFIFERAVSPGNLTEKIIMNTPNGYNEVVDLYQVPANLKQFLCLIFKFEPAVDNKRVKGFSISKIEQND